MKRRHGLWSMLAVCALGSADVAAAPPRRPLPKADTITRPAHPSHLVVKFHDALRMRAHDGRIISGAPRARRDINAIAAAHDARFAPLIRLPGAALHALETRAEQGSGRAAPDLRSLLIVTAPDEALEALANDLLARPETEFAYFAAQAPAPPCEDAAPVTPDYLSWQDFRGPDPGLDIDSVWAQGNARGGGIRIADVEYAYVFDHEDLCGITFEAGQTIHPTVHVYGWDEHGTATLGMLAAGDYAFGCLGLVPDAEVLFFPEWTVEEGQRRVTAIANAVASVDAGDIVMLEMQTIGDGGNFGPAELEPAVWMLTRMATDAGVIVVAAAGSGSQDLDAPAYQPYRDLGDSGAILVGAGTSSIEHTMLDYSTFGSRVNLQGWGENVFTLGYGDFAEHGDDENQRYTAGFGGTSSAVPFVVAACVAVQGIHEQRYGTRLAPEQMRDLLVATGIAQGAGGGHVGPFPNIAAALASFCPADFDGTGVVDILDLLGLFASWGEPDALRDIAPPGGDGTIDLEDLSMLLEAWGSCG